MLSGPEVRLIGPTGSSMSRMIVSGPGSSRADRIRLRSEPGEASETLVTTSSGPPSTSSIVFENSLVSFVIMFWAVAERCRAASPSSSLIGNRVRKWKVFPDAEARAIVAGNRIGRERFPSAAEDVIGPVSTHDDSRPVRSES
jgi:hypothetical protein